MIEDGISRACEPDWCRSWRSQCDTRIEVTCQPQQSSTHRITADEQGVIFVWSHCSSCSYPGAQGDAQPRAFAAVKLRKGPEFLPVIDTS